MIEKEIIDRVSLYPGRITLEPVEGAENTYDMVRADEPRVPGTPINKATLESIIHSRLTGRYYAATNEQIATTTLTGVKVNPLPTASWVVTNSTEIRSGNYTIRASSPAENTLINVFDGNTATFWGSSNNPFVSIELPTETIVKKIKMRVVSSSPSNDIPTTEIQGSNNGTSWTTLHTVTGAQTTPTEFTLDNPGAYRYYRFSFRLTYYARVYEISFSEYDLYEYQNTFTLSGVPAGWTKGQRLMIETPSLSTFAVKKNTLNGVNINTILQPNKRYELVYNGSSFDAKEV